MRKIINIRVLFVPLIALWMGWGCVTQYADPVWHEAALTNSVAANVGAILWDNGALMVSDGVLMRTGRKVNDGCVLQVHYYGDGPALSVDMTIFRYDSSCSAEHCFNANTVMLSNAAPIYMTGVASAFHYAITKSRQLRNDPEGGGGYADRRNTQLTIWKGVTVVYAIVQSDAADKVLNADVVIGAINQKVGLWDVSKGGGDGVKPSRAVKSP